MSKKNELFGLEQEAGSIRKLPTLLQYLKTKGNKRIPEKFTVFTVWEPGKWDNFTLQTEHFRVRVDSGTPLYNALLSYCSDIANETTTMAISVTDRKTGTYRIVECDESGSWDRIGSNGWKFDN